MSGTGPYIHASAVLVAEGAVLIRGASGAGKSQLALALMAEARRRGLFTGLIGDDRIALSVAGGRVLASGHPAVRGLIEERGTGLLTVATEPAGVLCCVIDLSEAVPRLPEDKAPAVVVEGVSLPALTIWTGCAPQEGARRILAFLNWV